MSIVNLIEAKIVDGNSQPLTYGEIKDFINSLTPEQLEQPLRIWGEGFGALIYRIQRLDENYINPSGEGYEPVSSYKDDPEILEDEPIVYPEGSLILEAEKY